MFSFASSKWSLQLWNHVSILRIMSQFSKRHVLNQIQKTWSYKIVHIFMNDCKATTLYFTITQKWHVTVTKLITNILDHTYTTSYVTFPQHNFPSCPKFLRYMETPNSHAQYNIHWTTKPKLPKYLSEIKDWGRWLEFWLLENKEFSRVHTR